MADWKLYRNEEYGFGFRYPGEWNSFKVYEKADAAGYTDLIYFCLTTGDVVYKDYPEKAIDYACADADMTLRLAKKYKPLIDKGFNKVF